MVAKRSPCLIHTRRRHPISKRYAKGIESWVKIIGIDLGQINNSCCMAVLENNQLKVIENAEGARTTRPSSPIKKTAKSWSALAKRQAVTNPKTRCTPSKRLIGRRFEEKKCKRHRPDAFSIVKLTTATPGGSARQKLAPPQNQRRSAAQK